MHVMRRESRYRPGGGRCLRAWAFLAVAGCAVNGTAARAERAAPSTQPASQPVQPAKPLPGPRYAPVRYDDDFSYLDGPKGSYAPDFFDPIKRIRLGDDLTLSLGGEARGRVEAVTHKLYGAEAPSQDTYFLHRYLYHADLEYRRLLRLFVQGTNAWVEDRDGTPLPQPEDRFDVHQMFIDLRILGEQVPLTLRFGRQELLYGKERLVSPLGWANVQRAWDGVKTFWRGAIWDVDAWYAHPVEIVNRDVDNYDSNVDFYGLYATYKGIRNHGVDVYFLSLRDENGYTNSNVDLSDAGHRGDLTVMTAGSRLWGKTPVGPHVWDYDTEFASQFGQSAGDNVCALMGSADTGYTLSNVPAEPRIGLGFDYASGDGDPRDGTHGTFNQLFPLGHAYFGYLDQVGRQNIWAQNVNLTLKPIESVTTRLAWHTFWLDKNQDALYNAAGGRVRRSLAGGVSDEVGHELDLTIQWRIDPHASLLFGYSHLWPGDFISETGSDLDPDLFYLQYLYQF